MLLGSLGFAAAALPCLGIPVIELGTVCMQNMFFLDIEAIEQTQGRKTETRMD